jgi:hypothetical protein
LELRVVPILKDEGEDRVEEVSDMELDDGDERSELGEPGTLVGGRASTNGGDESGDDLQQDKG